MASERRQRNRHGEGGRLRDELIAAATALLAESGDERVSLRAVARRVGIAAPSVYLHFPSKEALVRAVVEAHFVALRETIEAALAPETDPAARLLAGCLAYCRFASERPVPYRILFGDARRPTLPAPSPDGPGETPGEAAFGTLVDAIAACIATGAAPPADPFRLATDVWPALHGLASLRRASPDFPWPPLEEQVRSMLERLVGVSLTADRGPEGSPPIAMGEGRRAVLPSPAAAGEGLG
jgi:AcrR family transcriptional regulator